MEYLLGDGPQPGSYGLVQPGGYPALRGMMTWSINWDAVNACDGTYSYAENFERIFGDISTGVAGPHSAHMALSPNPVRDVLHLDPPVYGSITVRDLSGRIVQRSMGNGPTGSVDVRSLAPAIYVLEAPGMRPARFMKD
jgi:hypothetical protein